MPDSGRKPPKRTTCRRWTEEEKRILVERLENDISYHVIAQELGRTFRGVEQAANRLLQSSRKKVIGGYTKRDLERMLGVVFEKVSQWIDDGWLKANCYAMDKPMYYVDHDDLISFLENPQYWHHWDIEDVQDQFLREWCQEIRPSFLSTSQASKVIGYSPCHILYLIHHGQLNAVRRGSKWMINIEDAKTFQYK